MYFKKLIIKCLAHLFTISAFAQTVTLQPLELSEAFTLADSNTVLLAIKSGEYDTSITTPASYTLLRETFKPANVDTTSPIKQILTTRNYVYRTVAVGAFPHQISDSVPTEDLTNLKTKFEKLEYAGTCFEHTQFVQRLLDKNFTTILYNLHRNNGDLIDHTVALVYWEERGKVYAVTVDGLMGYVAPLDANGMPYPIEEIGQGFIDSPQVLKTKRYCIDSTAYYCNLYLTPNAKVYSNGKYIYHYYYDDISVLAKQELIGDEYPKERFLNDYVNSLTAILIKERPASVKQYHQIRRQLTLKDIAHIIRDSRTRN